MENFPQWWILVFRPHFDGRFVVTAEYKLSLSGFLVLPYSVGIKETGARSVGGNFPDKAFELLLFVDV